MYPIYLSTIRTKTNTSTSYILTVHLQQSTPTNTTTTNTTTTSSSILTDTAASFIGTSSSLFPLRTPHSVRDPVHQSNSGSLLRVTSRSATSPLLGIHFRSGDKVVATVDLAGGVSLVWSSPQPAPTPLLGDTGLDGGWTILGSPPTGQAEEEVNEDVPALLNASVAMGDTTYDPCELARRMAVLACTAVADAGGSVTSGALLRGSPAFRSLHTLSGNLRLADPSGVSEDAVLAFWLNVHTALTVHAAGLVAPCAFAGYKNRAAFKRWTQWSKCVGYIVCGTRATLHTIEHAILRGKSAQPTVSNSSSAEMPTPEDLMSAKSRRPRSVHSITPTSSGSLATATAPDELTSSWRAGISNVLSRGRTDKPARIDRDGFTLHAPEPLITLVLTSIPIAGMPHLRVWDGDSVCADLRTRACTYLRRFMRVDVDGDSKSARVLLPPIIEWYSADFGLTSPLATLVTVCPVEVRDSIQRILDGALTGDVTYTAARWTFELTTDASPSNDGRAADTAQTAPTNVVTLPASVLSGSTGGGSNPSSERRRSSTQGSGGAGRLGTNKAGKKPAPAVDDTSLFSGLLDRGRRFFSADEGAVGPDGGRLTPHSAATARAMQAYNPKSGTLSLRSCSLNGLIPPAVRELKDSLRVLDVRMNNIERLPSWLGELSALTVLRLATNSLHETFLLSLPPTPPPAAHRKSLSLSSSGSRRHSRMQLTMSSSPGGALGALDERVPLSKSSSDSSSVSMSDGGEESLVGSPVLPAELIECVRLREIDLGRNQLGRCVSPLNNRIADHLLAPLHLLPGLRDVLLEGNELSSLPAQLLLSTSITSLDLSNNRLARLVADPPASVGTAAPPCFPELATLDIRYNAMGDAALVAALRRWPKLTTLRLSGNLLTFASKYDKLWSGVSLGIDALDVRQNRLVAVPSAVLRSCAPSLRRIIVTRNHITDIGDALWTCTSLRDLWVGRNELTTLLPPFSDDASPPRSLPCLQTLFAFDNLISELPPTLPHMCPVLTSLDVSANCLTELIDLSPLAGTLHKLAASSNALTCLPDSLATLTNLAELVLNDNQLTSACVPTISRLVRRANIQLLNLTDNHLEELDLGVGGADDAAEREATSALRVLLVSFNQLSRVRFGQLRLPQLNECDLSFNRLQSVPDELLTAAPALARLGLAHNAGLLSRDEDDRLLALFAQGSSSDQSRLEHLHLDGTGLTRVPLRALARMPSVTTLTMSDNLIADITGLAPLVQGLQVLDVSVNRLAFLPDDLARNCLSLQDLNVCSNFVAEVPQSFEAMHSFTDVDLSNNRLVGVPRASLVPKSAFSPSTVRLSMNMFNNPGRVEAEVARFGFEDAEDLAAARSTTARALATDPASAGDAERLLDRSLCETRIPVSAGNVNVGWAEMRGRRPDQQDAGVCERVRAPPILVDATHAAYQRRTGASQVPFTSPRVRPEDQGHMWLLTGVFDGHAGTAAAEIAASHVAPFVRSFLREEVDALSPGPLDEEQLHGVVTRALHRSCREIHQEAVRACVPDGTTGIFVLMSECFAWTATVGDSRALMGHRVPGNGARMDAAAPRHKQHERSASMAAAARATALARSNRLSHDGSSRGATAAVDAAAAGLPTHAAAAIAPATPDAEATLKGPTRLTWHVSAAAGVHLDFSTIDHSPHSDEERDRIRRDGGFVSDAGRVQGVLALSRAFGDIAQQPAVTWEPDVAFHFFDSAQAAQILVLACDGVFDVISSSAALQLAGQPSPSVFAAAAAVRDAAFCAGSTDNITTMIVRVPRT